MNSYGVIRGFGLAIIGGFRIGFRGWVKRDWQTNQNRLHHYLWEQDMDKVILKDNIKIGILTNLYKLFWNLNKIFKELKFILLLVK